MGAVNMYTLITVDEHSVTPKYLQLTNSILKSIEAGKVKKGDHLPSINELSYELDLSRDTIERGYKHLKNMGVVGSVPGKGYFIAKTDLKQQLKIFLLFNKLSTHKKIIYDSFVSTLGEQAVIDFYIYNNDFNLFRKLLQGKKDDYSHFVIIPHFLESGTKVHEVIDSIPKDKLILMDKLIPGLVGSYGAVYENFDEDIYEALEQALEPLSKYHTLKIIFPEDTYHPSEILNGFQRFCSQYAFNNKIVRTISSEPICSGEVYINLMESDLVILIERLISLQLRVGQDVGVISYNETPLKKIILKGITTISTDFLLMGKKAAQLILEKSTEHIPIPFCLTLRESL
jgi:DNA-binding transcriptional regulator YhcF (GntR family)